MSSSMRSAEEGGRDSEHVVLEHFVLCERDTFTDFPGLPQPVEG